MPIHDFLILGLPVVYFGILAYILRQRYFLKYFLFNILCFVMFIQLFELNTDSFALINSQLGMNLVVPESYNIFDFIQDSYLLAYIYTPIFCYYVTSLDHAKSAYLSVFNWFNIIVIILLFFASRINIIYAYFLFSLLVLWFFKVDSLWKKTLQATAIALGFFSVFFDVGYYISDWCGQKNAGFCQWIFSYHNFLGNQFSGLFALLLIIWFIFILLGIYTVLKLFNCPDDWFFRGMDSNIVTSLIKK